MSVAISTIPKAQLDILSIYKNFKIRFRRNYSDKFFLGSVDTVDCRIWILSQSLLRHKTKPSIEFFRKFGAKNMTKRLGIVTPANEVYTTFLGILIIIKCSCFHSWFPLLDRKKCAFACSSEIIESVNGSLQAYCENKHKQ